MNNMAVRSIIRVALIIAGVAVAYFAAGRLLLVLGAPPNGAGTTVWLPSGISVAALLLFGPFAAIGSFLGSVTLELKNGVPLPAGFIVGLANAGSELLCYFLIVRGGRTFSIVARWDVLRFVMAALLGALISAIVGVSTYVLFAVVPASLFGPTWLTWFGSAAIGIMLITPFLVYSVGEWLALGSRARYLEYAAALVVLVSAAFLWQEPVLTSHVDDPVILAVILVLFWIAFRFPPEAMTLAIFFFAIASVGGAVYHLSHAPSESAFAPIFVLQLMLGGLALIGYLLNSMVADLQRATAALQEDISKRAQVEEKIRKLNEELEAKVLERTQQLLAAQEDLVRKEKLAILGQLSGSVGHELRNPLGVISNAVYFLKMVLTDADETTKEYLDIIKKEIDNSLRIITDLLDFARTRSPQRQSVSVAELARQSLERCAFPENVAVTVDITAALPNLNVDPAQLGQVLQNLITNAVQAMPAGGALRVAARRVLSSELRVLSSNLKAETLRPKPDTDVALTSEFKFLGSNSELKTQNSEIDGDFVEISVSDSGEGISAENMKKLFQPLFTTKTKGIGLGLVVCKNLVEANGGQIMAESEPGEGTTFTLLLPT